MHQESIKLACMLQGFLVRIFLLYSDSKWRKTCILHCYVLKSRKHVDCGIMKQKKRPLHFNGDLGPLCLHHHIRLQQAPASKPVWIAWTGRSHKMRGRFALTRCLIIPSIPKHFSHRLLKVVFIQLT